MEVLASPYRFPAPFEQQLEPDAELERLPQPGFERQARQPRTVTANPAWAALSAVSWSVSRLSELLFRPKSTSGPAFSQHSQDHNASFNPNYQAGQVQDQGGFLWAAAPVPVFNANSQEDLIDLTGTEEFTQEEMSRVFANSRLYERGPVWMFAGRPNVYPPLPDLPNEIRAHTAFLAEVNRHFTQAQNDPKNSKHALRMLQMRVEQQRRYLLNLKAIQSRCQRYIAKGGLFPQGAQQSNGTQRDGFEYANTWTVGSAPVAEKFTTINAGVKRRKGMVSAPDVELPTRRDGSELVTTTRSASFPPKGAAGPGTVALNHAGIMSFRAPDTRSTSNANKEDSMLPSNDSDSSLRQSRKRKLPAVDESESDQDVLIVSEKSIPGKVHSLVNPSYMTVEDPDECITMADVYRWLKCDKFSQTVWPQLEEIRKGGGIVFRSSVQRYYDYIKKQWDPSVEARRHALQSIRKKEPPTPSTIREVKKTIEAQVQELTSKRSKELDGDWDDTLLQTKIELALWSKNINFPSGMSMGDIIAECRDLPHDITFDAACIQKVEQLVKRFRRKEIEEAESRKLEEEKSVQRKLFMPPIPKNLLNQVEDAMDEYQDKSEQFVDAFNIAITRKDLLTLHDGQWLNDEVINFYMKLLEARSKQNGFPPVYTFNTFFYTKLTDEGYSRVKRWTKKVDIFSYEILLVPVHLGVHWCMAVIDLKEKKIVYYDSLLGRENGCLQRLLNYLQDEYKEKNQQAKSFSDFSLQAPTNFDEQRNGSDCGVYACQFAEVSSRRGAIVFKRSDMPYFRKRMVAEILSTKMLVNKIVN